MQNSCQHSWQAATCAQDKVRTCSHSGCSTTALIMQNSIDKVVCNVSACSSHLMADIPFINYLLELLSNADAGNFHSYHSCLQNINFHCPLWTNVVTPRNDSTVEEVKKSVVRATSLTSCNSSFSVLPIALCISIRIPVRPFIVFRDRIW